MCFKNTSELIRILSALVLAAAITPAGYAQSVNDTDSLIEDQGIDLYMQVLAGPVWQPVWFTPQEAPGFQRFTPVYKQQPPGSQQDFRPAVEETFIPDSTPQLQPTSRPDSGSGSSSGNDAPPDPVCDPSILVVLC